MNVSVLGCGRWGSFLAWYANKSGHRTTLWGRKGSATLQQLRKTRQNEYLQLPDEISISDDLSATLKGADFIIISINAQNLRSFLRDLRNNPAFDENAVYILCMKGVETNTGARLTEVFSQEIPDVQVAIWVGPGHVQSFILGVPNCMVVDSANVQTTKSVIDAFGSDLIRFYLGNDVIGNEIGAAAKNVVGLAAGMLDGLGLAALKGALMARAPHEISRLISALGGNSMSAYGLAHLGDFEATLFSLHSHNRRFGEEWVKGNKFGKLAEGVATAKALADLSAKCGIELPICDCVNRILFKGNDPLRELDRLFSRPIKNEFY